MQKELFRHETQPFGDLPILYVTLSIAANIENRKYKQREPK